MTTPKDKDRIPEFLKTDNLKSFFKNLNEKILCIYFFAHHQKEILNYQIG